MRLLGISTGEAKRRAAHARVENRAFVATDMEVFAKTNVHFDSRAHSNFFFFWFGRASLDRSRWVGSENSHTLEDERETIVSVFVRSTQAPSRSL